MIVSQDVSNISPVFNASSIDNTVLQDVESVTNAILKNSNGRELRIIGGSACALLDHLFEKKPLRFRDVDYAIVLGTCIRPEDCTLLAEQLQRAIPGAQSVDSFEERERTPEHLPLDEQSFFSAGRGFFLRRPGYSAPIIDISLFAHEEDLKELNGYLAQDKISIVLDEKRTFTDFLEKARRSTFEQLRDSGWVEEPPQAYDHWVKRDPQFINWNCTTRRPYPSILRLSRCFAKMGLLPDLLQHSSSRTSLQSLWKDFQQLATSGKITQFAIPGRLFQRCLNDTTAHLQLAALCQAAAFDKWLPYLNEALYYLSPDDIEIKLSHVKEGSTGGKLLALLSEQPLYKQMHTLFYAHGGPDVFHSSLVAVWKLLQGSCQEEFGPLNLEACSKLISSRMDEVHHNAFQKSVLRIINSTSLQDQERVFLLLRALVTNMQEAALLFPQGATKELEAFLQKATISRVGLLTGVFDPITLMHVELVSHAIHQMVLDKLVVAPAYLSSENPPGQPWKVRRELVEIGLAGTPEVEVIGSDEETTMQTGIASIVKKITNENVHFFHVSGADAFNRFVYLRQLDQYRQQGYRCFVIGRQGVYLPPVPNSHKEVITFFRPSSPLCIDGANSSSDVRQRIRADRPFEHLVPQKVAQVITERGIYSIPDNLRVPGRISAPIDLLPVIQEQFSLAVSSHISSGELSSLLAKLLEESGGRPVLALQKNLLQENRVQVSLGYQQSANHTPIIFEEEVNESHVSTVASQMLHKLNHQRLGHGNSAGF